MFNKRVYLAKSNLASGFDFEYVKSNLLRIPDIEIIEYGDGFEPSECACLIYIPCSSVVKKEIMPINKNSFIAMQAFLSAFEAGVEGIPLFTYCGQSPSWDSEDVEDTFPMFLPFKSLELIDENVWEGYGELSLVSDTRESLLHTVSILLTNSPRNNWRGYTRYFMPEPEYCLPPIPSFEERRSKGTKRHSTAEVNYPNFPQQKVFKKPIVKKVKEEPKQVRDYSISEQESFKGEEVTRERYSNKKTQRRER